MPNELFTRNLDLFRDTGLGELADQQQALTDIESRLIGSLEQSDINVELQNGRLLYQSDGLSAAREQISQFAGQPNRYHADPPQSTGASSRLQHDLLNTAIIDAFQGIEINAAPDPEAGYFISFGLGLGLHIPLILDRFPCRNLIIVEPNPELIHHALHISDWQDCFEGIKARGGELLFLTDTDPLSAAQELLHLLRSRDYPLADGSYIYQHYAFPYFDQLLPAFRDNLVNLRAAMGFFEDECLMLENAWANFQRYDFLQLEARTQTPKAMPAFIIGSGPSFDKALPVLRDNRDNAIYFSVGTGISSLIQNGIHPDFHCEVENTDLTVEALEKASPVGFPDTILIASSTVPPETAALFKSVIFCHRDSVVPSRLLVRQEETVPLAVPTVANLACRSAMSFGLPEIVLFGIDFGSAKPDQHHSGSSVYETEGSDFFKSGAGMAALNIPVTGNRGGTVYTNRSFFNAKIYLEKLLATSKGYKLYNAGDGLEITGASPVDAAAIQLQDPPAARGAVIKDILADLVQRDKNSLCRPDILNQLHQSLDRWFEDLEEIIRSHDGKDLSDFHLRIRPYLQQGHGDREHSLEGATRAFASGTIMMMIQTAWFFMRRMDNTDRENFWNLFQTQMMSSLQEMKKQTDHLITSL